MARNPAKRWRRDDDHEQHLKLAWVRAHRQYKPEAGLPIGQFVERVIADADKHWSRMTRREKMRQRMTRNIDDLLDEPRDPKVFLDSVAAASEIAHSLDLLSDRERFVVLSILSAGRSTNEVGRDLGVSAPTVRSIQQRALRKVRRARK